MACFRAPITSSPVICGSAITRGYRTHTTTASQFSGWKGRDHHKEISQITRYIYEMELASILGSSAQLFKKTLNCEEFYDEVHLDSNDANEAVLQLGNAAPRHVHGKALQCRHDLALNVAMGAARHLDDYLIRQVQVDLNLLDAVTLAQRGRFTLRCHWIHQHQLFPNHTCFWLGLILIRVQGRLLCRLVLQHVSSLGGDGDGLHLRALFLQRFYTMMQTLHVLDGVLDHG